MQVKSYKKLSSYHHWPDERKRFVCIISMRSWWNNMTIHSFIKTNRIIRTKVMIVVGTSIMLRYKKTICPIHHQTEHINSSLLYKERAFRRHKDNTKSRHIRRRRTFSPLIYLQFSKWWIFKLCGKTIVTRSFSIYILI